MPTLKISRYKNAWVARWKNTRIKLFPEHQFKEDGNKGNLIEFFRLQDVDLPALCISNKVRTINGRAYTISSVWLTDEAAVALHKILGESIKERALPKERVEYTDEALQKLISTWTQGQSDDWLINTLNEMDLPHGQYMMAVDFYKKIGDFDPNKDQV
jgi:hypothetical protein